MVVSDLAILARNLVGADSTSFTNANLLIYLNMAYEEIVGKLITADGSWQFGDSTFTGLPTFTANMTAGTGTYQFMGNLLASGATGINATTPLVNIYRVEVLDNNGIWHLLNRIYLDEITYGQLEHLKTNGLPVEYELREDFIILYPAPAAANVTLTAGLRALAQRSANVFANATSTTVKPGFAPMYHHLLAYKAAIPFAAGERPERVPFLMSEATRIETEMLKFYSQRDRTREKIISTRRIGFR